MIRRFGGQPATSSTRWTRALDAQLIVSLAVWGFFCARPSYINDRDSFATLYFSVLIWLCSVLGFWAGLGRARWRWLVVVPAGPLLGWIASFETGELFEFELFCLGIVTIVTLTTTVLRQFCGQLSLQSTSTEHTDGLQFGIKQVLLWTGVAAVGLGIARVLVTQFDAIDAALDDIGTTLKICGLTLGISTAVVINIWAMLGSKIGSVKVLTVVGMTALAMFFNQRLLDHLLFASATLIAQLMMVVTLTILRRQGYRFVRATKTRTTEA